MHLSHSDWLTIDMLRCYLPSESLAHFDISYLFIKEDNWIYHHYVCGSYFLKIRN